MMQERQKGETVRPTALLQLMEQIGPTKVSRQLGVSTTTLYKARKSKLVSKSIELAASAVLHAPAQRTPESAALVERSTAAVGDKVIVIMEVPKGKVELLKRVALQFGAETVES